MLEYYTRHFGTVEVNNSFYRLPLETGLDSWRVSTPPNFCFAVKGSRYITHMKKLNDAAQAVERFFGRVGRLGRKLGPVVFQLPPRWEADAARLENFLEILPRHRCYAFELRDPTWHTPEIYAVLRRHNAAFCIFEIAGWFSGIEITADFTYIRLHGPDGAYQGSYPDSTLAEWAARIEDWRSKLRAVYVYFDNDQSGYAPQNALTLKRICAGEHRVHVV
jgi:uncharacterized protein YecE (DUF72 family)